MRWKLLFHRLFLYAHYNFSVLLQTYWMGVWGAMGIHSLGNSEIWLTIDREALLTFQVDEACAGEQTMVCVKVSYLPISKVTGSLCLIK